MADARQDHLLAHLDGLMMPIPGGSIQLRDDRIEA